MNMLDRVFIVSSRRVSDKSSFKDEDKVLSNLMESLSDGGIKSKVIISNMLKGDLLNGSSLKEFTSVVKKDWKCTKTNRGIFRGEIASAYNHASCWNEITQRKIDLSLILEDDVIINNPSNLKSDIEEILSDLEKEEWGLCLLGRTIGDQKYKVSFLEETPLTEKLVKMKESKGSYSYLINLEGAKKLFNEKFSSGLFPVDEYFNCISGVSSDEEANKEFEEYRINTMSTVWNGCLFDKDKTINRFRGIHNSGTAKIKRTSNIKFYTVATKEHDGLDRLIESAEYYGIHLNVLGLDAGWTDGDVARLENPGGGQKINILKKELEKLNDDDVIFFVDGYDVIFMTGTEEIEKKWKDAECKVLFGAEKVLWPDRSIEDRFPEKNESYRFLNSGNFMGEVGELKRITAEELSDSDDDQLYYQLKFLSGDFDFKLDYKANIFQCIAFCADSEESLNMSFQKELKIENNRIKNIEHDSFPCSFHGNGSKEQKIKHNWFCNYLGGRRNGGEATLNAQKNVFFGVPKVLICLFLESKMSDIECIDCIKRITNLSFPKENIVLCILYDESKVAFTTDQEIEESLKLYKNKFIKRTSEATSTEDRYKCLELAKKIEADNYLYVDNHFEIQKNDLIENLLFCNRALIAPLGTRREEDGKVSFSNYWGALDENGFYWQSEDYLKIASRKITGIWDGPYVFACYLLNKRSIEKLSGCYSLNYEDDRGSDMSFMSNALDKGIIPCVDNRFSYGKSTSF